MTSTVATRLRGLFNRRRDDGDYLFLLNPSIPVGFCDGADSDDDDTSSISSHSTTSTVDDIPGTGRIIDKHLYQKLGRKLECFIFRMKLGSLPPAQIFRFIEETIVYHIFSKYTGYGDSDWHLKIAMLSWRGKSKLYGLKSLVQQTK